MRFQPGNKLGKGGLKNPPGGRPTKKQAAAKETAQQKAIRMIEEAAEKVVQKYLKFADIDPATSRHAVDKLIPPESKLITEGPISISVTIQGNTNGKGPA